MVDVRSLRRRWAWFGIAGSIAFVTGMIAVANDSNVPAWERRLFRAANDLPDWLHPVLWLPQQLGAFLVVPLLALLLWFWHERRWAVAVMIVGATKLITERIVKVIVTRDRPAVSIGPDIDVRGDVPTHGESFVSGHAILIAALVCLLTPLLPQPWRVVAWIVATMGLFGRVYVGAHNPLDVVSGAGLGFALASGVGLVLLARGADVAR